MRFSGRTDNPAGESHPVVRRMDAIRATGLVPFDLTGTDATGWSERRDVERAALDLLSDPSSNRYCPDPQGLREVRDLLSRANGGSVATEDWFLCASTSEAYSILFQLLCDPGDQVVVNRPSYPLLDDLARHGGIRLVDVPLRWSGRRWCLDIGRLELAFRSGSIRAFCLIQPGNPTGWFLSPEERTKVVALSAKYDVALISDEVFADYTYVAGFESLLGEKDCLCFVLSGLSKGFGLPGFKLGWIGMSGPSKVLENARERLQRINDSLLSASTPVQRALNRLWTMKEDLLKPIRSRLDTNLEEWTKSRPDDSSRLPVEAGWMAIMKLAPAQEERLCGLAMDRGILAQPGFLFDLPMDGVVLSLLTETSVFREGLEKLQDIVDSL